MKRQALATLVVLALVAAVPVFAGGHKKCTMGTQECLDAMAANLKNYGWVGVETDKETLKVTKVMPGSPAEDAGIKEGDILFAMNGIELNEANHAKLKAVKKNLKPGSTVDYTIKRDGYDRQVTVTLAPMPADVLAKWIGEHMLEHASAGVAVGK